MQEDKESKSIGEIVKILSELNEIERSRVIGYVSDRFTVEQKTSNYEISPVKAGLSFDEAVNIETKSNHSNEMGANTDIRQLKLNKKPANGVQMAVLVAYYLKEVLQADQKDVISAEDIEKYFNQAGYPLPTGKNGCADTLNNAKKSGYFESAGKGNYKLTPVGFNLAAYNMPTTNRPLSPRRQRVALKKNVKGK